MEKMRMETPDLTAQNVEKIAALFPNCITEMLDEERSTPEKKVYKKAVNFALLRQMLSGDVVEGDEAYEFTWVGKKAAIVEANKPIRKTLRPCPKESVDWDTTENLYIEGDNLEVLKLLQESYLGKVNMIYIDPPYNTGNDFIYKDDFREATEDYVEALGIENEHGERLFKNTDTNGRFHSDWCSMMYPRLMLSRGLLAETGLIFVSIDDNELENMRRICDEVFGESNFIDTIIWKKRYGGGAKEKWLVSLQEYVLVYCKNASILGELFVPLTKENIERYYQKRDENYATRGGYRTHPLEATKSMDSRPNLVYPIPAPDGSEIWPKRQWLWSKERAYAALANGELEIYQGAKGEWQVSTKQYLKDDDGSERQGKMFSIIEDIYTQHGTNEMLRIMGNAKIFPFPKPSAFIKQLLMVGTKKDSLVLDFFSGSATTAHAVMNLNNEDGGRRKYILVQIPQAVEADSDAGKAGFSNLCEIGEERIRRSGALIKEERPLMTGFLDTGFRVFKLDSSNMNDVYYAAGDYTQNMLTMLESNVKPDRTDLDLLFGCLLDWGLPLSLPYKSEKIEGCTVHTYNDGDLIACFDENIPDAVIKEIARRQPLRAVFRDSSFNGSPAKINVGEIFKMLAPDTRVKVI